MDYTPLITFRKEGIYCPPAGIYIDPWQPVDRAVITHGHSDHARPGHRHYLAHRDSVPILSHRLGSGLRIQGVEYGKTQQINGVSLSLHPAGHIIGSAQVRLEHRGEVAVITGDYKLEDDGISTAFEPVRCHTMVSESTFGLPVFRWKSQQEVVTEITDWSEHNRKEKVNSVLIAYSLGKAQRLIRALDGKAGRIFVHGAIQRMNEVLAPRFPGLAETGDATREYRRETDRGSIILAPSSALGSPWLRRFEPYSLGIASGWMTLRGNRRRRGADRGFILSDHADWDGLNQAVRESGAENLFLTHGYSDSSARWFREQGLNAREVETGYGEQEDAEEGGEA